MAEQLGCIYKHTNLIHKGWSYIGQTIYDINTRWKFGHGYDKCLAFKRAIDKYGWDNFAHEIIEDNIPVEKLDDRERYWIQYYHTYVGDPECKGYNMTIGGRVNRGRICSDETKEKTRVSLLGHSVSDHVRQRVSEASRGRRHSPEVAERIRLAAIGRDTSSKPILCIETGIVYPSISSAAKELGHGKNWIKNRIDNPTYFPNDFHFTRIDERD